ncbi:plasmid maintenance system killer [mine drainage metagenome]|uniref:Plasmid maintenance system killer n=1 Tax=mine drainage metagenome TaxID=410659 RepID=T0ZL13_9ZZZZ
MAIQSFACNRTEALFRGGHPREFRPFENVVTRKLRLLKVARTLDFLRSPPGNRLESLKGDRKAQHSIRINDQFRGCFNWTDAGPRNGAIVDYH